MKKTALTIFIVAFLCLPAASAPGGATDKEAPRVSSQAPLEDRGAGYLPYSEPTPLGSGGFLGTLVRTIFSLAIVLGLLYVTLWMIRKISAAPAGASAGAALQVVGRVYLSPKTIIYFVRVVDELLVIGTASGNISLLTSIRDERRITEIENALRKTHSQASGLPFSRFFDKSVVRFQRALEKDETTIDDQLRGLNDQIGRLRGLTRKRQEHEE